MVYFPFSSIAASSDLPDQKGANGKFLTTNGTEASWSDATKVYGSFYLDTDITSSSSVFTDCDTLVAETFISNCSVTSGKNIGVTKSGVYEVNAHFQIISADPETQVHLFKVESDGTEVTIAQFLTLIGVQNNSVLNATLMVELNTDEKIMAKFTGSAVIQSVHSDGVRKRSWISIKNVD